MRPHFIVIGAMKSGTSSLYRYVASHPDVSPSSTKETDFFTTDSNFRRGVEWYSSLFRDEGKIAFEASPNYAKRHLFPGVPGRMHSVLPRAKLAYVLRDPIDRAVSHYTHSRLTGRESRPFSEAIQDPASKYIQTSKYFHQLEAFLEHYRKSQILFVESDGLHSDTTNAVTEIFRFLGLSPTCNDRILKRRFHVTCRWSRGRVIGQEIPGRAKEPGMHSGLDSTYAPPGQSVERLRLSSADLKTLSNALTPDVDKLRRFSGLAFPGWSL